MTCSTTPAPHRAEIPAIRSADCEPNPNRVAAFARAYVQRYGLAIVKIPPGLKGPTHPRWNEPGGWFADSAAAVRFYEAHPDWGMGAVLAPSGLCSLDVDNVVEARSVLGEFGVDVDRYANLCPTIVGNPEHFRVMFAAPAGADLATHKLAWPNQYGAGGLHTVLELRAGFVQDVLPPSSHPKGYRYGWRTRPNGSFPLLPDELTAIWWNWPVFESQAKALCPWALKGRPRPQPRPRPAASRTDGPSVIDEFNRSVPIEALLARYGYQRRGRRWLSPYSTTGLPGVSRIDDDRVFMHHASDPLFSGDPGGHPLAAFDFYAWYEHGGDVRRAVKAAVGELRLNR